MIGSLWVITPISRLVRNLTYLWLIWKRHRQGFWTKKTHFNTPWKQNPVMKQWIFHCLQRCFVVFQHSTDLKPWNDGKKNVKKYLSLQAISRRSPLKIGLGWKTNYFFCGGKKMDSLFQWLLLLHCVGSVWFGIWQCWTWMVGILVSFWEDLLSGASCWFQVGVPSYFGPGILEVQPFQKKYLKNFATLKTTTPKHSKTKLGGGFTYFHIFFFMFTLSWGDDPILIWLIFFRWVETTHQVNKWIISFKGGNSCSKSFLVHEKPLKFLHSC